MHNINMSDFVVSVISFIILIGLMVVVHEFGHFAVAKLCRVRVEAFSIGFGPRLFGFKRGDTDYKVCLLPLGGYVKMTGENPTEDGPPIDDPGAFTSHPRWQRMLIGLAGPVANFILAFVLMFVYYHWINEVDKFMLPTSVVEWVAPDSDAARAGFETGDVITSFDGSKDPNWIQISTRAAMNLNQTVAATVDRGQKQLQLSLHIPPEPRGQDFDIAHTGILPQFQNGPIDVREVEPGTPAYKAGLRAGDAIESVDGHLFHHVNTLLAYMKAGEGKPLSLVVLRNGQRVDLQATPAKLDSDWKLGFAPVRTPIEMTPLPTRESVFKAKDFCLTNSTNIVEVVGRLLTHKVSVSQLSGPIGIARMAGDAAQSKGYFLKFYTAAAISLNLGILNLLPFPILDGGLILLLFIEEILRHDISLAVKERIYQAAFVVLVVFFAFIIFNDVTKLPIFNHVKP
jgi:regulator of sigma E protease